MQFQLILLMLLFSNSMTGDTDYINQGFSDLDITKHQWKQRVIVVVAEDITSKLYIDQIADLLANEEGLKERQTVYYVVTPDFYQLNNGEKIGNKNAWRKFNKTKSLFSVLLFGLDGGEKLQKTELLMSKQIFDVIDGMPMRRAEIRKGQ